MNPTEYNPWDQVEWRPHANSAWLPGMVVSTAIEGGRDAGWTATIRVKVGGAIFTVSGEDVSEWLRKPQRDEHGSVYYSWNASGPTSEECVRKFGDVSGTFADTAGTYAANSSVDADGRWSNPLLGKPGLLMVDDPHESKPADPEAVRAWYTQLPVTHADLGAGRVSFVGGDGRWHDDDLLDVVAKSPTPEQITAWLEKHVKSCKLFHGVMRYSCRRCERRLLVSKPSEVPTDSDVFKVALEHHRYCHDMTKQNIVITNHYNPATAQALTTVHGEATIMNVLRQNGAQIRDALSAASKPTQPQSYTCITCGKMPAPGAAVEWWQAIAADGTKTRVPTCGASECRRSSAEFAEMLAKGSALQAGDYVRLEWRGGDWAIGEVRKIHRPDVTLCAEVFVDSSNFVAIGIVQTLGIEPMPVIERVPRSAVTPGALWRCQGSAPDGRQCGERTRQTPPGGRYLCAAHAASESPLDIHYDGVPLRTLLQDDELRRRDNQAAMARCRCSTTAQRAAVSAYHSAELRAKVSASTAADKAREVSVCCDSGEADE